MAGTELYADRKPTHRRTWTAAAIILSVVFIIMGQAATIFGVMKPLGFHQKDLETRWDATFLVLLGFAFTSLLVFLWVWLFERRPLSTIGFNKDGVKRFLRGYGIGLGFLAAVVGLIYALGGYDIKAHGVWSNLSVTALIPLLALMAGFIVQGSTEEIVMRGWLMQVVASRHGLGWGIGISSLIFSLLHAGNIEMSKELLVGLANIVLVAIFLGLYAFKEGSLWGVCAWHASWNWLLGVGFGLEVSGQQMSIQPLLIDFDSKATAAWWLTGAKFGPEGSLVATAVLIVGVIWLLMNGALSARHGFTAEDAPKAAKEA